MATQTSTRSLGSACSPGGASAGLCYHVYHELQPGCEVALSGQSVIYTLHEPKSRRSAATSAPDYAAGLGPGPLAVTQWPVDRPLSPAPKSSQRLSERASGGWRRSSMVS